MVRVRAVVSKVVFKTKVFILEGLLQPIRPPRMLRLGTFYGGWWIPGVEPERGAAVCVGAGTDVSFDLELQRLGYRVYTVDPTPSAVEFVEATSPELTLVPVGVWSETGRLEFRRDAVWTESWMIGDTVPSGTRLDDAETFEVLSLTDLLQRIDEPEPAVLKLDIEGAEHAVLATMVEAGLRPRTLAVEFDDFRMRQVIATNKLLRRHGYDLLHIENLNYIYAVRDAWDTVAPA